MRSARAYREGRNSRPFVLKSSGGDHFDPEMATAFLKIDLTHYDAMLAQTKADDQPPEGTA